MLSLQPTGRPHLGQRDGGETTDCSAGSRTMQTLRKLPMTAPNTPPIRAKSADSLTRHLVEENARGDADIERLRAGPERNSDPAMGPAVQ